MAATDFIASITASLAWPVVLAALLIFFRRPIRDLLGALKDRMQDLTEATGPGNTSLKFAKQLHAIENGGALTDRDSFLFFNEEDTAPSGLDRSVPLTHDAVAPLWQDSQRLSRIADVSPRGAFLAIYTELEEEIRALAAASIVAGQHWAGASQRGWRRLADEGVIPRDLADALAELQELRNIAAHSSEGQLPADALVRSLDSVAAAIKRVRALNTSFD